MVEYSASTARTLCGHVFRDWFGFQLDYSRNRSTREYSIRPLDFMYGTAPMPAGASLPSMWRSLILRLILQRRRRNAFHSKDLGEYRRLKSELTLPRPPQLRSSPRVACPSGGVAASLVHRRQLLRLRNNHRHCPDRWLPQRRYRPRV